MKHADQKSITQIAREMADLGDRAHQDRLYGEQQLVDTLEHTPVQDLESLVHHVSTTVAQHAEGVSQSDAFTLLAIRLSPSPRE